MSETAEQAMSRLGDECGSCEVEVVNPGQEGAEFFACQLQDPAFFVIGGRRKHYGYGSGKTILEAVLAAEKTMDNLNQRPRRKEVEA